MKPAALSVDLETTSLAFGAALVDVERRLVSGGWHDPQRLRAVAAKYGLRAADFLCPHAQRIFTALQANSDADAVDRGVLRAGVPIGVALDVRLLEVGPAGVEHWAQLLAAYRKRVTEARALVAEANRLLAGNVVSDVFPRFGRAITAKQGQGGRRGVA